MAQIIHLIGSVGSVISILGVCLIFLAMLLSLPILFSNRPILTLICFLTGGAPLIIVLFFYAMFSPSNNILKLFWIGLLFSGLGELLYLGCSAMA